MLRSMFVSDEGGPLRKGDILVEGSNGLVRRRRPGEPMRKSATLDGPRMVVAITKEAFITYPVRLMQVMVMR